MQQNFSLYFEGSVTPRSGTAIDNVMLLFIDSHRVLLKRWMRLREPAYVFLSS